MKCCLLLLIAVVFGAAGSVHAICPECKAPSSASHGDELCPDCKKRLDEQLEEVRSEIISGLNSAGLQTFMTTPAAQGLTQENAEDAGFSLVEQASLLSEELWQTRGCEEKTDSFHSGAFAMGEYIRSVVTVGCSRPILPRREFSQLAGLLRLICLTCGGEEDVDAFISAAFMGRAWVSYVRPFQTLSERYREVIASAIIFHLYNELDAPARMAPMASWIRHIMLPLVPSGESSGMAACGGNAACEGNTLEGFIQTFIATTQNRRHYIDLDSGNAEQQFLSLLPEEHGIASVHLTHGYPDVLDSEGNSRNYFESLIVLRSRHSGEEQAGYRFFMLNHNTEFVVSRSELRSFLAMFLGAVRTPASRGARTLDVWVARPRGNNENNAGSLGWVSPTILITGLALMCQQLYYLCTNQQDSINKLVMSMIVVVFWYMARNAKPSRH